MWLLRVGSPRDSCLVGSLPREIRIPLLRDHPPYCRHTHTLSFSCFFILFLFLLFTLSYYYYIVRTNNGRITSRIALLADNSVKFVVRVNLTPVCQRASINSMRSLHLKPFNITIHLYIILFIFIHLFLHRFLNESFLCRRENVKLQFLN